MTLMTIFISQKFVRILAEASGGSIPGKLVMSFLALNLPKLAVYILPLSLFLGIILAYSRVYADSEMTVLKACGVSEWYVVRVTLISSFVIALMAAALSLYVAPWQVKKKISYVSKPMLNQGSARFGPDGFSKRVTRKPWCLYTTPVIRAKS